MQPIWLRRDSGTYWRPRNLTRAILRSTWAVRICPGWNKWQMHYYKTWQLISALVMHQRSWTTHATFVARATWHSASSYSIPLPVMMATMWLKCQERLCWKVCTCSRSTFQFTPFTPLKLPQRCIKYATVLAAIRWNIARNRAIFTRLLTGITITCRSISVRSANWCYQWCP